MKSFTSVLVAGFAAMAQAVQLTNTNFNVQAGQAFEITWSDASGPVTLTLKNGPSTDLKTVSTIATGQSGTSFSWTPSSTLPTDQYAIEISDSTGTPNYSEQFTLTTSVTASASVSSASVSASASASATVTTTVAASTITSSASASSASAESSSASSAANSTAASTVSTSTRASTRTSASTSSTSSPTTVPGSDAVRMGSPIALIGLTVAAMLYFQ